MQAYDSHPEARRVPGPTCQPIFQIHPSLRCNLACAHCYSSSSPTAGTELDVNVVLNAITDAAQMGYEVVSLSGGEPMLYRGIARVLSHAKSLGLTTTVTTNGSFLERRRLERISDYLDLLAISVDGRPELHNEIRRNAGSFRKIVTGLQAVRDARLRFGFIHALTSRSWDDLPWLAEFTVEQGGKLLQVHPIEKAGRAVTMDTEDLADDVTLAKAYLLTLAIADQYQTQMAVQFDALHRELVLRNPHLVYALSEPHKPTPSNLSSMIGLLVLQADGAVVPVAYGLAKKYQVCNVKHRRIIDAWPEYQRTYPDFKRLCRRVFEEISSNPSPLVNWHELMVRASYRSGQITQEADRGLHPTAMAKGGSPDRIPAD